jgi:hypothetical protein
LWVKAVASDAKCVHGKEGMRGTKKTPWKLPMVVSKQDMKTSIHGQNWLSVFIDEAHVIRRRGPEYQYLVQSTHVMICATATPLHTGLSDLVNMAQVLRLPGLCSETGYNSAVAHQRKVDRLRTSIPRDELKFIAEAAISGTKLEYGPEFQEWRDEARRFIKNIGIDFQGRIIRRMVTSKDWKGDPINSLPPYQEAVAFLDLTDEEYALLRIAEERELKQYVSYLIWQKYLTDENESYRKGRLLAFDTKVSLLIRCCVIVMILTLWFVRHSMCNIGRASYTRRISTKILLPVA